METTVLSSLLFSFFPLPGAERININDLQMEEEEEEKKQKKLKSRGRRKREVEVKKAARCRRSVWPDWRILTIHKEVGALCIQNGANLATPPPSGPSPRGSREEKIRKFDSQICSNSSQSSLSLARSLKEKKEEEQRKQLIISILSSSSLFLFSSVSPSCLSFFLLSPSRDLLQCRVFPKIEAGTEIAKADISSLVHY